MEGVQVHCQCLLFVVRKNRRRTAKEPASDLEGPKGFALLPSSTVENRPQLCQLFVQNNIEVLGRQLCPSLRTALQQNLVEIVEVVFVNRAGGTTSESQPSPLMRVSVEAGNEKCVKELFGKKIVFCSTQVESSNLLKAVDESNVPIVENILSVRADISYSSCLGGTFLHLAVLRDQENLVNILLKHNANINAERNDDSTPLHLAVQQGNLNLVNFLLVSGACVDAAKEDGSTSLLIAVEQGNIQIVKLLLTNGADVTLGKKADATPLHVALQKDNVEVFGELLEQEAKVEAVVIPPCLKDSLLFLAIEKGCCEVVERLLERGANVDALNRFGESALERAVDYGHLNIIECILKYRPDANNKSNKKALTEAMLSSNKDSKKIVEVLLKYGFSLDVDEINNVNLIQAAVRKNYTEILQNLFKPGTKLAKSSSKLLSSTTLLRDAVKHANEEMVKLLLDSGVKPSNKLEGTTLIYEALNKGNFKIVTLLLAHGAGADDCGIVCSAAEKGCAEIVETIVQSGFCVDFEDADRRLAIVCAAENNHAKVVEILLKYGADSEKKTKFGRTALHAAAEEGHADVIRVLAENGANLEVKCAKGETPLSYAVGSGQLRAVEMLLKYGARLDVIDSSGGSPLRAAVEEEYDKIFKTLLDYGFTDPDLLKKTGICSYLENKVNWESQICFMLLSTGMGDGGESLQNEHKCSVILARHIIKSEAAGLCCGEENPLVTWGRTERSMRNFKRECEAELALLKSEKITDTYVSYHDVLMSTKTELMRLAKNPGPGVIQTVMSADYKAKFPIYGGCLYYQFWRGLERKKRQYVRNSS